MSKFFINRPIVAMVIAILTVIVGAVVIASLPVAQFPAIAPPEIQISAIYVGADAQTIEQAVATPIEQQMSGVDNMNYMYSLNATANGQMRMTVDFDVATDPNTEGEATATYLVRMLRDIPGLTVTRIASGLPMGGDLEFADELTLGRALTGRRSMV